MSENKWSAIEHFDRWEDALAWALAQRALGSPKYLVRADPGHGVRPDRWEVIQSWLWFM